MPETKRPHGSRFRDALVIINPGACNPSGVSSAKVSTLPSASYPFSGSPSFTSMRSSHDNEIDALILLRWRSFRIASTSRPLRLGVLIPTNTTRFQMLPAEVISGPTRR